MKKLCVLASALLLVGCACFDEQPESNDGEYHTVQDLYRGKKESCTSGTCGVKEPAYRERHVRKVYRQPSESYTYIERPVYQPRRVQYYQQAAYVPMPAPQPAPVPVAAPVPCYNVPANVAANGCQPTISETREPVEVVYKKTTYRTTYQPQTTSSVSYEKVPYTGQADVVVPQPVAQPVAAPAPAPVPPAPRPAPLPAPAPQPVAQPQPVPVAMPAPQPAPAPQYMPAPLPEPQPVVREVVIPASGYVTETIEISEDEVK